MNCPECGTANPEQAAQCAQCGANLTGSDPSEAPTRALDPDEQPTLAAKSPPQPSPAAGLGPGDRLGDRYEILSLLGTGGFGSVYKARDRTLDRTVALKILHGKLASNPEVIERFKREILLASKITHKNVVRIHDLGQAGDLSFVTMNFVEGTDLKQIIEREAPMSLEAALPLIRQICEALRAAHDAGVVHRDLKPQNILVGPEGDAYVADFGISRSMEEHGNTMTETGSVIGTLAYMSPEQARGEHVDHRSDLYSLGLIMYEMLAGTVPFKSGTVLSRLMKRTQEDVPSVDTTRAGLPAWIVRIVSRALARDVGDRYQNVGDLLRDLDRQRAGVALKKKLRTRIVQAVTGVALVGILATAITVTLRNREPTGPPALQAELVLVPFRNVSRNPDDDWTRTGVPRMLRFDLEQTKSLRVVSEERVQEIVDDLKLGRAGELDDTALQRIASILRVDNLLSGELVRQGEQLRLQAALLRVGTARIENRVPIEISGEGRDALFGMIEQLGKRVREELGLGAGRRSDVAEISSHSVEALRLYTEGFDFVQQGSDVEGVRRLEEALQIDPGFAIARAELAEAYDRLGRVDEALAAAERAADGVKDVSAYEFARIRAIRARLVGDVDAAGAAYRELVTQAPNRPEAHLALARFLEDTGDLDGALESMGRVKELDSRNPNAKYVHGRVLAKLGRPDEGLREFQSALELFEQTGNDEGRATVLNGLGNIYSRTGRYQEAMDAYRQSLEIQEQVDDARAVGVALHNIAMTLMDMGDYEKAIETAERALQVRQQLGDAVEIAKSYAGLGDIHNSAGNMEQAVQAYQGSIDVLRDSGDEAGLAQAFSNLGFVKTVMGQYNEAFYLQKNALDNLREVGDPRAILSALNDIGMVEQVQGKFDGALKYYSEGMELARQNGYRQGVIVLSMNLAEIHLAQGHYAAALAALGDAEAAAREAGDTGLLAVCLRVLTDTRRDLGDVAGAETALAEAAELNRELGSPSMDVRLGLSRSRLLLDGGQRERAAEVLQTALESARSVGEHRLLLLVRLAAAEARGSAADLEDVLQEAERTGLDPIVARAGLALVQSRGTAPFEEIDAVVRAANPMGMRDVLFRAQRLAAGALVVAGDEDSAAERTLAALAHLEAMRSGLEGETLERFLARPSIAAFAAEAADLLHDRPDAEARLRRALANSATS